MFTFDIVLDLSKTGHQPEITEYLEHLLGCFYDARQIIEENCAFAHTANTIRAPVTCPEADALNAKNSIVYAQNWRQKIEEVLQTQIQYVPTGVDPRYEPYVERGKPSFYVMHFGGYTPLIQGDLNELVPLYKIPFTYHDHACYNDIQFWENNYGRIYGLWFNGAVGEKFALRQMQDPRSALSVQGKAVCERIEAVTGMPTYYFLFNYGRRNLEQDRAWKCPLCGKNWLVEGAAPSDKVAFRCQDDRIVSGFTINSDRSPNRWSEPYFPIDDVQSTRVKAPKGSKDLAAIASEPKPAKAEPETDLRQTMIEIYHNTLLGLQSDTLNAKLYYDLSFCALFAGDYAKAIEAAQKAMQLNPRLIEVEANLALAYVLNDQYEKAEALYQKWKGKTFKSVDRDPVDKVFLSDIAELEAAGIRHPDFERVKRLFSA